MQNLKSHTPLLTCSTTMSSSSRKLPQTSTVVDVGCRCGRPKKLSALFLFPKFSKPKPSSKPDRYLSSSSALSPSLENNSSTSTFDTTPFHSESEETERMMNQASSSSSSRIGDSVAVVKDSSDPYLDFRHSMLQMILEKEIYSKDELRELLDCFLSLNSPYHHQVIVRAFTEIWNGVFSIGHGFSAGSSRARRRGSREF